jgi:tripartite-type tricarboxylate transporter receptor subunit TctC
MVSLAHTVNPWLYDLKGRYDPIKSFAPVAIIAASPVVLVVNPNVPVKSVADLVALAKKQPGKLQYASAGVGSVTHLAGELFKYTAKVDMLHVPFKGAGPATVDVVGGHTSLMFGGLLATTPQIRSGKLRALGVGGPHRLAALPEVPTFAEAGLPGAEATNWWGIVAPAGTPAAVVQRLQGDIGAIVDSSDTQKRFELEGADVLRMTSAEFGQHIAAETAKWTRVVKQAGIKAQ